MATFVPALLLVVYLAVVVCMLNRWDSFVAVTLIPVWAWAGFGMLLSLLSWAFFRGLPSLIIFSLCLLSGIIFSEESQGLSREFFAAVQSNKESQPEENETIRVININCGGLEAPLSRILQEAPDIVTIQNAPAETTIREFAESLFGMDHAVTINRSNAIVAKGELLNELKESESSTVHARLEHPSGQIIDVTTLQLDYCVPRKDMWKPSIWKMLRDKRVKNRRLVRSYLGETEIGQTDIGRIITGGFNTPPGDDVFRPLLSNGLVDTYKVAGLSWGNTYPSDYPDLRLDQIWVSDKFVPVTTTTLLNSDSSHRSVMSELRLSPK